MGINDRKSYIEVFYGEISAINSNRSKGKEEEKIHGKSIK